jgi:hypothetical protein
MTLAAREDIDAALELFVKAVRLEHVNRRVFGCCVPEGRRRVSEFLSHGRAQYANLWVLEYESDGGGPVLETEQPDWLPRYFDGSFVAVPGQTDRADELLTLGGVGQTLEIVQTSQHLEEVTDVRIAIVRHAEYLVPVDTQAIDYVEREVTARKRKRFDVQKRHPAISDARNAQAPQG